MAAAGGEAGLGWLGFALATVVTWGLYGVLLHQGQVAMGDPANGRYKAFLFVGVAYVLAAVLAPLAMLVMARASMTFPSGGVLWSLLAGLAGAAGAFTVLLAFGARGSPSVVMSIVFAGAPIVNAVTTLWLKRGAGVTIRWPFLLGIVMAALGGFLVTMFRPDAVPK
jgi:drug/metabolite transporter (DMT)-like permease